MVQKWNINIYCSSQNPEFLGFVWFLLLFYKALGMDTTSQALTHARQ
jgi:hypothetical protein